MAGLALASAVASSAFAAVELQLVTSGVPYIVGIEHAGDARLFLVSQSGQIRIYTGTQLLSAPFLDISSKIVFGGERGLLGLAFHPNYVSNGFFYVHYTNTSGNTVLARYQVSGDANVGDPNSESIVLTQTQPFTNHKGGQVRFGPDGFLYLALGDGGSGGDPQDNSQRLDTLLGKLLRIDVDAAAPYAIPPSNPFVGTPGARGEIWAYGLRNPWRFSFDRQTDDLFIADVGQGAWEEINLQPGTAAGVNYGWRRMEGRHCFNPSSACDPGTLTLPILEYSHALGCSVNGGFRYRGSTLTGHQGTYVFSDYCNGRIWGATPDSNGVWTATQMLNAGSLNATFGEDRDGELYFASYGSDSSLFRLVTAPTTRVLTVTIAGGGQGVVTSSPTALHCGSVCGVQVSSGTTITLIATPSAASTFAGWTGDADCADGSVTITASIGCTATFTAGFTDDPIVIGSTIVKAVHVTQLRSRVDTLRLAAGLGGFTWTDPTIGSGTTLVRAVHISELRTALQAVYSARSVSPPSYADPALAAGNGVKAIHIAQLRNAIVAIE